MLPNEISMLERIWEKRSWEMIVWLVLKCREISFVLKEFRTQLSCSQQYNIAEMDKYICRCNCIWCNIFRSITCKHFTFLYMNRKHEVLTVFFHSIAHLLMIISRRLCHLLCNSSFFAHHLSEFSGLATASVAKANCDCGNESFEVALDCKFVADRDLGFCSGVTKLASGNTTGMMMVGIIGDEVCMTTVGNSLWFSATNEKKEDKTGVHISR